MQSKPSRTEGDRARCNAPRPRNGPGQGERAAFTLVEILVATALTLLMMGLVVTVFALVSDNISGSRSTLEMTDRLRAVKDRLQADLDGITAPLTPPLDPASGLGYVEYIEGPIGPVVPAHKYAQDTDLPGVAGTDDAPATNPTGAIAQDDLTAGDNDDILMFTTRSSGEPFVGRFAGSQTAQSDVAEVCWFVRGNKLYRRQLLVLPGPNNEIRVPGWNPNLPSGLSDMENPGFYRAYDVSARQIGGPFSVESPGSTPRLAFNSLGDLTRREYRYGHQPWAYPYDARFWGRLGLPTLWECSFTTDLNTGTPRGIWPFPYQAYGGGGVAVPGFVQPEPNGPWLGANLGTDRLIVPLAISGSLAGNAASPTGYQPANQRLELTPGPIPYDAWRRPHPWAEVEPLTGQLLRYARDPDPSSNPIEESVRTEEDLVLENVLSFDVKIWDPGAPIFQVATNAPAALPTALTSLGPDDALYIPQGVVPYITYVRGNPGSVTAAGQALLPIGYGAFVDLNYMCLAGVDGNTANDRATVDYPLNNQVTYQSLGGAVRDIILPKVNPLFHGPADVSGATSAVNFSTLWNPASKLFGTAPLTINWLANPIAYPDPSEWFASVYDTHSSHYERDGINQDDDDGGGTIQQGAPDLADEGTDGWDNDGANGPDDPAEFEAPPPYGAAASGIQIRIRVFDPGSRQIREITIVQQFAE